MIYGGLRTILWKKDIMTLEQPHAFVAVAEREHVTHALSIGLPPLLNAALFKPNVQREIRRVFAENFVVYGARKVWRRLRREASPLPAAPWSG